MKYLTGSGLFYLTRPQTLLCLVSTEQPDPLGAGENEIMVQLPASLEARPSSSSQTAVRSLWLGREPIVTIPLTVFPGHHISITVLNAWHALFHPV